MRHLVKNDPMAQEGFDKMQRSFSYENYSPVKRVEGCLNISGISQKYNIPYATDPLEFEQSIKALRIIALKNSNIIDSEEEVALDFIAPLEKDSIALAEKICQSIKNINPDLREIQIDKTNPSSYVAFISGVCSSFPKEDIEEFCNAITFNDKNKLKELNNRKKSLTEKLRPMINIENSKNQELLEKRLKVRDIFVNWCPSEKTFEKIYQATKEQNKTLNTKKNAPQMNVDAFINYKLQCGHYDD